MSLYRYGILQQIGEGAGGRVDIAPIAPSYSSHSRRLAGQLFLLVVLRTPNVIKQSPALASPHTDLPFTCRDVKRRHQTPRGGRVFAQQIRQGRERWFGESQYESALASYTNEIDAVTLDSFGYLNEQVTPDPVRVSESRRDWARKWAFKWEKCSQSRLG